MRLPLLEREQLDEAQSAVYERIVSGARGAVRGPFLALLHSPKLAEKVEQLGVFVRYECAVPQRWRELAILVVARHWRADYEWYAHAPIAEDTGLPRAAIQAFGAGGEPEWPTQSDNVVVALSSELLATGRVSKETYAAAENLLGRVGLTDLVGLLGYYSLLALTLNAHEVGVPTDAEIPWPRTGPGIA